MGRLKNMQIVFDSNKTVFSSGDVIRGKVFLQVDRSDHVGLKTVQKMWMRFRGKAKTDWSTDDHTHTLTEMYFDETVIIFKPGQRAQNLHVPPGKHGYPFQFQLPRKNLPATFEGKYGYVRYKAKATVSLKRTLLDKEFKTKRLFSMRGPTLDLNTIPEAKLAVNAKAEAHNCCGCTLMVSDEISVGLSKQGYVPGESIVVTGQVDNRDSTERITLYSKLLQIITFHSKSHQNVKKNTLATVSASVACPRGRVTDFSIGPLRIPPVPPSGLPGCGIIDVLYRVQILSANRETNFTIQVGNVPLRIPATRTRAETELPPYPGEQPNAAVALEAPPPSYEEAAAMSGLIPKDRSGENYFASEQFVPSYPYFSLMVEDGQSETRFDQ
ncbi:arrestin domain-containing protein 3-like [Asterias amurensis]|uniref:arrestin domain-containing protein 3-like n=1 Tax=Asterias amurensis TaxID=7602 RepID=UPI003AB7F74C